MTRLALIAHQFRYDQKTFWRSPTSVFFTVALPVLFLFIFATIFGSDTIDARGGVKVTTYYVPAIITLAVISATFVSPAIAIRKTSMPVTATPCPGNSVTGIRPVNRKATVV